MKKIALYCVLFMVTCLLAVPASADQLTDAQKQKSTVDKQKAAIEKAKREEKKKKDAIEAEKKKVVGTLTQEQKEYQQVVGELKKIDEEIKSIEECIEEAEANYRKQQELFKTRMRVMYENTDYTYFETLIQSRSLSEFFERIELVTLISKKDKEIVELMKAAKQDIEYKKAEKEKLQAQVQNKASQKQKVLATLQVSRADLDKEIKRINTKLNQLEAQEDELEKQSAELESQIKALQAKNTKYAGGTMKWPVPSSGSISSYFGNRLHPILKKYRMHTGIDINAASGASIIAANKGTVMLSGWQSGYGYTVIVDHGGGISTLYAHCSRLVAAVGQNVEAGEVIAKVGSTGLSTGSHLHFEVRNNGTPVNPLDYVSP
ncbi:MAG: peptidoglycan DD-metalloendopeptidase family protein [Clostridia bacterium]|nr:peptidoglycan DD-metalloendopeptidase family protein [Clostridia bacterium]